MAKNSPPAVTGDAAASHPPTGRAGWGEGVPVEVKYADALLPTNAEAAAALTAFQELVETPFISGTAAALAETIVTILRVAEGEVESLTAPGTFLSQWIYLVKLQTPLEYTDASREIRRFAVGDIVLLGLTRAGKIRDRFADLVQHLTEGGTVLPNMLVITVPAKKQGFAPAIAFRQLVAPK